MFFVAACWSDHTWLAEGWKKKGCKIAEFRCDATSDITINLHKRFLRKPSLDGDQDGFLERKGFFGCVKIWKSDIFTHQTRNRMSGFSKLCLAYTACRYPKKIQTFEEVFFFPCNSKQANWNPIKKGDTAILSSDMVICIRYFPTKIVIFAEKKGTNSLPGDTPK